jgi:hypothetical protein
MMAALFRIARLWLVAATSSWAGLAEVMDRRANNFRLIDILKMNIIDVPDPDWLPSAIWRVTWIAVYGLVLYVVSTSWRPFPGQKASAAFYYLLILALVLSLGYNIYVGFTYRHTYVENGVVTIRQAYYGIFRKDIVIPKGEIAAFETFEFMAGVFAHHPATGIRVRLVGGTAIDLAQGGRADYRHQVELLQRDLEAIPPGKRI